MSMGSARWSAAGRQQRRRGGQIEVKIFSIRDAVVVNDHRELFQAGIGVELGRQIAHGLRTLGHAGNGFLKIPFPLLGRQLGEEPVLGVVIIAVIPARNLEQRPAAVVQQQRVIRPGRVLAVLGGVNDFPRPGGERDAQMAIEGWWNPVARIGRCRSDNNSAPSSVTRTSGVWKASRQGERHRHVRDAGDGRQGPRPARIPAGNPPPRASRGAGWRGPPRGRSRPPASCRRRTSSLNGSSVNAGPALRMFLATKSRMAFTASSRVLACRGQLPRQCRGLRGLVRPVQHRLRSIP